MFIERGEFTQSISDHLAMQPTRSPPHAATIDREIFTLKIIRAKIFVVLIFHSFAPSAKFFFLAVDGYNMDKSLHGEFLAFSLLPGVGRARYH